MASGHGGLRARMEKCLKDTARLYHFGLVTHWLPVTPERLPADGGDSMTYSAMGDENSIFWTIGVVSRIRYLMPPLQVPST